MELETPESKIQPDRRSMPGGEETEAWESAENPLSDEESRLLDWLDQLEDREPALPEEARGYESWLEWKKELRRRASHLALVPAQTLIESARAAISSLALQQKKRIRLKVFDPRTAADLCMDMGSHEIFRSGLVHLLRNSVSHGIEPPVERQTLGKSPEGEIQLRVEWRDGVLQLLLADDGRGLQAERIQKAAIAAGIPNADQTAVEELIFNPQVSVRDAESRDEWAGTAVGLDAVRNSLQGQGGDIEVISAGKEGRGLELRLWLRPRRLALAVCRLMLTTADGLHRSIYVPESVARRDLTFSGPQLSGTVPGWLVRQGGAWLAFERFTRGPAGTLRETPESLIAPFVASGARYAWAEEDPDFRIFRRAERAWAARIPQGTPGYVHQLGLAPLLG